MWWISERSSSSFVSSSGGQSGPTTETSAAAPAADPRRLTDAEIEAIWSGAPAGATDLQVSKRIADAQLEKARVTISEAEVVP